MSDDLAAIRSFKCSNGRSGRYARDAQAVIRDAGDLLGVSAGLDCLVATEDNWIIGAVVFEPCDRHGFGVINSIGVAIPKQDNGVARDLKKQAMNNCSFAGATKVFSRVHRNNLPMQRVNDHLGIEPIQDPDDGKYFLYTALIVVEDEDGWEDP